MDAEPEIRTLYETQLDVRFSARYHQLCERWCLLLNEMNQFCGLFFSSAAVVAVYKEVTWLAIALGIIIASSNAINIVIGATRKAALHRDLYRKYQDLDARISETSMSLDKADAELRRIEIEDPATSESFRKIAQADNLRTHGHRAEADSPRLQLSMRERLLRSVL